MNAIKILETLKKNDGSELGRLKARNFEADGHHLRFIIGDGAKVSVNHSTETDTFDVRIDRRGMDPAFARSVYYDMIAAAIGSDQR